MIRNEKVVKIASGEKERVSLAKIQEELDTLDFADGSFRIVDIIIKIDG